MADIFISYSSKDRAQAVQLTELLSSAGLSVWIDKQGIEVATSWSGEIVDAIEGCKAFVVLLSPNSVESVNVVKEVSLAAEQKKKILPLDLEPVDLPRDLKYHLAGLQRAPMTNIDAIIRAIGKLGLEATQAPSMTLVREIDSRKSLMILPFEDLSPTGDNQWFADGIVSELINVLSNVKALRVIDAVTTKEYKAYTGNLAAYAREMRVRYFVQGDVRKFGDQIKVSSRLLDIETGDHLWQDSLRGKMDDIFDIQEQVAEKVVAGLKIHLASDEQKKLAERGTLNAQAYEYFLQGRDSFARQTMEGVAQSVELFAEAIKLDPNYADAYAAKAGSLTVRYRVSTRDPAMLEEAFDLVNTALRLKPDLSRAYNALAMILLAQGKFEEAEQKALEYIRIAPDDFMSHGTLGYVYSEMDQEQRAIAPFEASIKLNPDTLVSLYNLVHCCYEAKEHSKLVHWATIAIPKWERHLKLFPASESHRVTLVILLYCADRKDDARALALTLTDLSDGFALYNLASALFMIGDHLDSIRAFQRALHAGYRYMPLIKTFMNNEPFLALTRTPEYAEAKQMVEALVREEQERTNG